jgi:hypothetical protein
MSAQWKQKRNDMARKRKGAGPVHQPPSPLPLPPAPHQQQQQHQRDPEAETDTDSPPTVAGGLHGIGQTIEKAACQACTSVDDALPLPPPKQNAASSDGAETAPLTAPDGEADAVVPMEDVAAPEHSGETGRPLAAAASRQGTTLPLAPAAPTPAPAGPPMPPTAASATPGRQIVRSAIDTVTASASCLTTQMKSSSSVVRFGLETMGKVLSPATSFTFSKVSTAFLREIRACLPAACSPAPPRPAP